MKGLTILLTTHYIEEAQALCDRVALMDGGKLEDLDTPENLICKLGAYAVDEMHPDGVHSSYFTERSQGNCLFVRADRQLYLARYDVGGRLCGTGGQAFDKGYLKLWVL